MMDTNDEITEPICLTNDQTETDVGLGLTFGPAWLRQLSVADGSRILALPPSPGLAFQLAKNRYSKEEMLVVYETIMEDKTILTSLDLASKLANDFEDLFKKEAQMPVSSMPLNQDEQVGCLDEQFFFLKKPII
jgi:hypothetical protein